MQYGIRRSLGRGHTSVFFPVWADVLSWMVETVLLSGV